MNHTLSIASILRRRLLPAIAVFTATIGSSLVYLWLAEPEYVSSARLVVEERAVSISELGQELTASRNDLPGDADPLAIESELIKSQAVVDRAIEIAIENGAPAKGLVSEEIAKEISVKIIPATNILEVSYRSDRPRQSTSILDAILQAAVDKNTEAIRLEASTVRNFLETEVPKLQSQLAEAETAESQYRQQTGLISLDEQTADIIESLSTLEAAENQLVVQLQGIISRENELEQITEIPNSSQAYTAVRAGQTAELVELRQQLLDIETQVANAQAQLGARHPDMLALSARLDEILDFYTQELVSQGINPSNLAPQYIAKSELSQNLLSQQISGEIERSELAGQLGAVQTEQARREAQLAEIPSQQRALAALLRRKEETTNSLALLQLKLEQARLAEAQLISNIRIIDAASTPVSADWPQPMAVLVLAIATGSVLAAGAVMLLEILDDSIYNAAEIQDFSERPHFGTLPKLPEFSLAHPKLFLDDPALVDPYRRLLQKLEFCMQGQAQMIVVSSAIANEGKSLVTAHLAAVSALLSRRTLIIDLDLRRPSQVSIFQQPASSGLETVLSGQQALIEAVQSTTVENLWLLSQNNGSQRPSVLLERMLQSNLLKEAKAHFDFIVIDTPPLGNCADAISISSQSDGMLLVMRSGFTPRLSLQSTIAELTNSDVTFLGTVMNGNTALSEQHYYTSPRVKTLAMPSSSNGA